MIRFSMIYFFVFHTLNTAVLLPSAPFTLFSWADATLCSMSLSNHIPRGPLSPSHLVSFIHHQMFVDFFEVLQYLLPRSLPIYCPPASNWCCQYYTLVAKYFALYAKRLVENIIIERCSKKNLTCQKVHSILFHVVCLFFLPYSRQEMNVRHWQRMNVGRKAIGLTSLSLCRGSKLKYTTSHSQLHSSICILGGSNISSLGSWLGICCGILNVIEYIYYIAVTYTVDCYAYSIIV